MSISWDTISPTAALPAADTHQVLTTALRSAEQMTRLLRAAVEADETVLLLVNDPHRSTQTRPALRVLAGHIEQLRESGELPRAPRFRALVATGTHRFPRAQREAFDQATFVECGLKIDPIAWHDAANDMDLASIAGVRMNRLVADSRFLLPIGSVEPHYFAGVTGPHKTLTIGCLSTADIERNHAGALNDSSAPFRLEGNPVYENTVECVGKIESMGKSICALGELVVGQAVAAAVTGEPIEVVKALLPQVRQVYEHCIEAPYDILHLRVPDPLGRSLYQADKALKNNHLAIRDSGFIMLDASCAAGVGPAGFLSLLRRANTHAAALQIVSAEGYHLSDHKAVKLRHLMDPVCRNVCVALVTKHLSQRDLDGTGLSVHGGVDSAMAWASGVVEGAFERGLLIEDAGMVCTTLRRADAAT